MNDLIMLSPNARVKKDSQILKMILGNEHMADSVVLRKLKGYGIPCKDNVSLDALYAAMAKVESGSELIGGYQGKAPGSDKI